MPFSTVKLKGGVNAELTPVLNEAGISASNLIRFKGGLPQKLGGWSRYYATPVPTVPRELHAWEDLATATHLAIAGNGYLGVLTNNSLADITPNFNLLDFVPSFSTTAGSTTVNIALVGANVGNGDVIVFQTPVSVGGLILDGTYPVLASHGPDSFDIQAATNAATTVVMGGAVPIFTASSFSSTIAVQFPNHGYAAGAYFDIVTPTNIAGITLQGLYMIDSVMDASNFTIVNPVAANANATVPMNNGKAHLIDWIAPYLNDRNSGFGIGGFGQGGFGTGFPVALSSGTKIITSSWSLDNWGEILVGCAKNGPIFEWGPSQGVIYARVIKNSPITCGGIFVAMPEQIMVAWAASVLGVQDPMLVRWCEVSDYTTWTADVSNQAGSFRIPRGSTLVGGLQAPQQALLWTDLGIWSMQYVGYPLVFGFNELASGCGLLAQHAVVVQGTSVFWMSQKNFYVLAGGSVQPIECSVWDSVFQNMNPAFTSNICAAANSQFNEVTWYYPSAASAGENDLYVKFNTETGEWDQGALKRSAWIDQSVLGPPLATDPSGLVFQHESSPDADGQPMDSWFETGDFMLSDAEDICFIDWVLPDFKYGNSGGAPNAQVNVTIRAKKFASDSATWTKGPYTVGATTRNFDTRIRGRLISMRVESLDAGSFWRLGGVKFRYASDGRN